MTLDNDDIKNIARAIAGAESAEQLRFRITQLIAYAVRARIICRDLAPYRQAVAALLQGAHQPRNIPTLIQIRNLNMGVLQNNQADLWLSEFLLNEFARRLQIQQAQKYSLQRRNTRRNTTNQK